ncbi:MAG: serine hydrolase [Sphingobacteriales bacterium]
MRKSLLFSIFLLISAVSLAQTKDDTSLASKKLDEYLNSAGKVYKFNGSVLIARKGKIILEKGYGWKNVPDRKLNDSGSIFQIGSLTKPFTAEIILKLQEQSKLSLYDKLDKYFPGYPKGDKITIENLLSHTSGIHNYTDDIDIKDTAVISHPVLHQKVVDAFINKHMEFKPGAKFSYCNSDYYLLGLIIEKVTGKPYEKAVREIIFDPLKMSHSGFDFIHLADTSKTSGYVEITEEKQTRAFSVDSTVYYSAGAIYSTTGDLFKWARSIANKQILSADSWNLAFTPHLEKYGLGWWIDTLYNRKYIYHSGGLIGFMSFMAYYPDDDFTIILLNNFGNYGNSLVPIYNALSAIMFNEPYSLWENRTEIKAGNDILKQYAGVYRFDAEHSLVVTFKNSKLFIEASNPNDKLPKLELHAESETKFYIKEAQLQFEFVKDNDSFKLVTYNVRGKDAEWIKIK